MTSKDTPLAALAAHLAGTIDVQVAPLPDTRVRGGCINECYRWDSGAGPLFVKLAMPGSLPVFEAEAAGLRELALADAIRVPRVLAVGAAGNYAYLVLEWLELRAQSESTQRLLGEGLVRLHMRTARRFGWERDNTIGSTPQVNTWSDDWQDFFREQRLQFQLDLARRNGHGAALQARGAELLQHLPVLLGDHRPQASLLHGDLWSGNAAADQAGTPVIFDPAVYYGDREADLAMTRLFGGFGSVFYEAYEQAWPLPEGAAGRVDLYNLYHVLNHTNLFGGAYLGQAIGLIDSLLERIR
jgi:protein-ribulosamine 3-kinase